jgi:hypothetical protein
VLSLANASARKCFFWKIVRDVLRIRSVLLTTFSRLLSRCYPLSYRSPLLGLFCVDETSSAQWTICVPSLQLLPLCRERARKGRCADGNHANPQALSLPGHHCASVVGTVPVQLSLLLSTLLLGMKHDETDRFMSRHPHRCLYRACKEDELVFRTLQQRERKSPDEVSASPFFGEPHLSRLAADAQHEPHAVLSRRRRDTLERSCEVVRLAQHDEARSAI